MVITVCYDPMLYFYPYFGFRENFILLDVFYSQLSYEHVTQQEAYPIFSLLCELSHFQLIFKLSVSKILCGN